MKKFVSLVLAIIMVLSLCACGSTFRSTESENELGASVREFDNSVPTSENDEEISEVGTATFDEIYYAYKENELAADDLYQYNRYRVTAKINGISSDGLLNLTGGAILTLETKVDNTIVFFCAEFEKEQEENLKTVKVGDTITFEGKCLDAGNWSECELIVE